MTSPDRLELLSQVLDFTNELRWDFRALVDRLDDWTPGYPSGGNGGGSAIEADPNAAQHGRPDPQAQVWTRYDAELRRAHMAISALYAIHREHLGPKPGMRSMSDPGCELHAKLGTDHRPVWVATYAHVDIETSRKGGKVDTRRIPACHWCWRFVRANNRPPSEPEVRANHEGRRVRVSA